MCTVRLESLRPALESAVAAMQAAAIQRGHDRAAQGEPPRPDIVGFTSEAISLLALTLRRELSLLSVFFPAAASSDPRGCLEALVGPLEMPVYERVRGAVVGMASVPELCGIVDVLLREAAEGEGAEVVGVLVDRMLADAQERLTFRCQAFLRDRGEEQRPACRFRACLTDLRLRCACGKDEFVCGTVSPPFVPRFAVFSGAPCFRACISWGLLFRLGNALRPRYALLLKRRSVFCAWSAVVGYVPSEEDIRAFDGIREGASMARREDEMRVGSEGDGEGKEKGEGSVAGEGGVALPSEGDRGQVPSTSGDTMGQEGEANGRLGWRREVLYAPVRATLHALVSDIVLRDGHPCHHRHFPTFLL